MVAHRRLSDRGVGEFRQDAPIQTPRRVALLARGPMVLVQNFVDEGAHHAKLRPGPRRIAVRRGQRIGQRLAHHAAADTELRGDTRDRADPELMLPTQLLEQIHFGFPVHARSPDSVGATVGLRDRGVGQNPSALLGQNSIAELPLACTTRALASIPSRNILLGSISAGVTAACMIVLPRRDVSTTGLPTLPLNDPTGWNGASSAARISSPASRPALWAGVCSITPLTKLRPCGPVRERMPMPG